MLEEIFPFSYRVRNVLYLVAVILVYLFLPIFITVVGSIAASVPYVSAVLVLLTVVVTTYCVGGIVTALLFFFGKIG
ncbi:MAG: hypothetical protein IKT70_03620 [Clostridia bacterium]|nr:hypothetical protein [Clostridia bacterium]